ncbi:MAG: dephospho-CoA kinase [Pseudomonadota bacterium]
MTLRLGLTGSIGMGKSTTAEMFRAQGAPVYDADAAVHGIYGPGGAAVKPVTAAFADVLGADGGIDRTKLRARVVGDRAQMATLESIVHPLVGAAQIAFLEAEQEAGQPYVVLDIPLLFETGGDQRCTHVAVVTAPASVQRERVLARGAMDEAAFQAIVDKQVPDAEKRARADFVVSTAFGFEFARAHVHAIDVLMRRIAKGGGDD